MHRQLLPQPSGGGVFARRFGRSLPGGERGQQARRLRASLAIRAMAEVGVDISTHTSKHLSEFLAQPVETVITVCGNADQACPLFPGQMNRHHWPFHDPAHATGTEEEKLRVFRQVRDEIRRVFEAYAKGRLDAERR
jgi:arsenate reductase (thioredoxin)